MFFAIAILLIFLILYLVVFVVGLFVITHSVKKNWLGPKGIEINYLKILMNSFLGGALGYFLAIQISHWYYLNAILYGLTFFGLPLSLMFLFSILVNKTKKALVLILVIVTFSILAFYAKEERIKGGNDLSDTEIKFLYSITQFEENEYVIMHSTNVKLEEDGFFFTNKRVVSYDEKEIKCEVYNRISSIDYKPYNKILHFIPNFNKLVFNSRINIFLKDEAGNYAGDFDSYMNEGNKYSEREFYNKLMEEWNKSKNANRL